MKRTTVKIPDELDARLRHEAERRGVTIGEVVHEALAEHLGARKRRQFRGAGMFRSGESDISERIEEILAEEWTDPHS